MLLPDWLQMLLHDDVIDVQNDEASEDKKNKKNKNSLYLFCTSVRENLVCARISFIRVYWLSKDEWNLTEHQ